MTTEIILKAETHKELMERLKIPEQSIHYLQEAYYNLSVPGIMMAVHDIMEANKGKVH